MRFILIYGILIVNSVFCCQIQTNNEKLIGANGWFLTIDPQSRFIVYFKSDSPEPDEYIEGHVYLYDVQKGTHSLLNSTKYLLNYTTAYWSKSGEYFFLSDGQIVYRYSFILDKKLIVYEANENEIVNDISASDNGQIISLNIKSFEKKRYLQKILIKKIPLVEMSEVYTITDSSQGEELRNHVLWDKSLNYLYIHNIEDQLLSLNLNNNSINIVDDSIITLLYVDSLNLYYLKAVAEDNILVQYDLKNSVYFDIMKAKDLQIDYVGPFNEGELVISMEDNVFRYNETGYIRRIENLSKDRFIYVDPKIAVFKKNNDLYFQSPY